MRKIYTDIGDPDPYQNYAWMRNNSPVSLIPGLDFGRKWIITGYDEAKVALGHPDICADRQNAGLPEKMGRTMLGLDGPQHTRLRGIIAPAFTPRAVSRWAPCITRVCHELIDAFDARREADLVAEYAMRAPVAVIHELMGVPPSERLGAEDCIEMFLRASFSGDGSALDQVEDYLNHILAYKRRHPGEDAVSALLTAYDSGDLRDEAELDAILYVLVGAGFTTTAHFMGSAILRLLLGRAEAGIELGTSAIEEVFRYDSSVQLTTNRYAVRDLSIGGQLIAGGDTVIVSVAAANRDPAKFDYATEFRPGRRLNQHLALGYGAHYCLGAALARLEVRIALRVLKNRLSQLSLAVPLSSINWCGGPMMRGPRELPVTFALGQLKAEVSSATSACSRVEYSLSCHVETHSAHSLEIFS